jgi:predicted Rdx family selenoprotein
VAALIAQATGVEPEVVEGARGEFSIRVGETVVARKDAGGFPDEQDVVRKVRDRLTS